MEKTARVGKYELGKTIGVGSQGKVKFGINKETSEKVAIKILSRSNIDKTAQIKKEMINHKHIVNLKDVMLSKTKIYLVFELVTGGELFSKLATEGKFDEATARNYFQQLIAGIHYCHASNICHRDLKPENLLLDETGTLKISGVAHKVFGTPRIATNLSWCGTPNYVAPEVLDDSGYEGTAADGIPKDDSDSFIDVSYKRLHCDNRTVLPFDEPTQEQLFKKIKKADFKYPSWFSTEVKYLITRMLIPDPKKRMTINALRVMPWFNINLTEVFENPCISSVSDSDAEQVFQSVEEVTNENHGLKITNAFDLISMSGAFDLSIMLQPASKSPERIKRYTRFSSEVDPDTLFKRLIQILVSLGVVFKQFEKEYKIQVTTSCSTGILAFTIEIYLMAPKLHMVDFRKKQGDILEFHKLYKLIHEKCLQK